MYRPPTDTDGRVAPAPTERFRLLVADGSPDDVRRVVAALEQRGLAPECERVADPAGLGTALERGSWDLVVCADQTSAGRAAELARRAGADVPVMVAPEGDDALPLVRPDAGPGGPLGPFIERQLRERENRTAAEEAARLMWRSDARFRALVQHAADGVMLLDADQRISYASPPCGQLLRVPVNSLLGHHPAELVRNPGEVEELLAHHATEGGADGPSPATAGTVRVVRGDGTPAWHEWQAVDMRQEPNVRAVALTLRDVTEAVDADERARLVQRISLLMREQVEIGPILTCLAGETGRALDVDAVDVRIVNPDEPSGQSAARWSELDGASPDAGLEHIGELFSHGSGTLVVDDVGADERLPPAVRRALVQAGARVLLAAPLIEDDQLLGGLVVHRTARRPWGPSDAALVASIAHEAAIQLRHARARAHEQRVLERTRQLDRAKSEFVSSVSHELRTPLASIIGYLEMILDGDAGTLLPEQRRMLTAIERNSRSLNRLIEDLLIVSRIEARSFSSELEPTSLGAVIDSVMGVLAPSLSDPGQALDWDVDADLPLVLGNADQLEQMLLNVIGNAIKFTPLGGDVAVRVHRAGDEVVIEVADAGIGIPADELPQLFTRFFRSTAARERAIPGTGLGLAIVKEIVEQHHGSVAVDSTVDVGTTVTIRLPLATRSERRRQPPETPPNKETQT